MKRKRRSLAPMDEATPAFLRGVLVTGMLVALTDRRKDKPQGRKVLRQAVQGGAALAAGTVAAEALVRRDYKLAAMAVAAGAAGVVAAGHLFDENEEDGLGQEK